MNIPTVRIELDDECYPPMFRVIEVNSGKCVAAFDDEDDAANWAVRHGYDVEYSPHGIDVD